MVIMMNKSLILWTWKQHHWKKFFNFYSTFHYINHLQCPKSEIVSTNIAMSNLVKNGELNQARKLFDEMRDRTVVSYNIMVSGYSRLGKFTESLNLVSTMHHVNMKLNETTFSSILSVCARLQALPQGKQIHGLVLKSGYECFNYVGIGMLYFYASCCEIDEARKVFDELHEENELVWSVMLVGYVQCNLMSNALDVFNRMPRRDVVAWTTVISGHSRSEDGCRTALQLFKAMRGNGEVVPNEFTLDCIVRACGKCYAFDEGRAVHALVIKFGYEFEDSISNALIGFYCDCESIDDAKIVYKSLVNPCLNDSNTLIEGLLMMGRIDEAEFIFNESVKRDPTFYNVMIKGYAMNGRVEEAKRLYHEMPVRTLVCSNTMISVYSRDGDLDKALELFEENKGEGNSVAWNSMISGFVQNDQHENAVKLYINMRRSSITQTRSTFSTLLRACACLGSLQQGKVIHADLIKTPFESNMYVGTALIDMYSKCGSIADAQRSFACVSYPNVAAWTALISGYANHGRGYDAILLYEQMLEQGINPNAVTFVGVLSACTHAGLVSEGMRYFHLMKESYGITPTLEHYTCVVDLLGRSGQLLEVEEFINHMPIEVDEILLISLLNACWFWMDIEVAERVAGKILSLNSNHVATHVIMSNIYARLGRWGKKMKARKIIRELHIKKDPGFSWIELNNRAYMFTVDDKTHPFYNVILSTLEHLTANVNFSIQSDIFSSQLKQLVLSNMA